MPLYTVRDTKTKKESEVNCSYDELQTKVKAGEWVHIPGGGKIIYDRDHLYSKVSTDFRSRLKQIHKAAGKNSQVKF